MGSTGRLHSTTWPVLAIALLTGPLLVAVLIFLHGETVRAGEKQAAALSQVIAEQATRTLQSVDARLQLAASRLEQLERSGRATPDAAGAVLAAVIPDLPHLRALWVVDVQGRVIGSSEAEGLGLSLADREYFQAHRRNPGTGFFVGPMLRSRISGGWFMSASRPILAPDGSLRAVITGAIEPGYFEEPWRGVELGAGSTIILYHRSGQVMMRSPSNEAAAGRDHSRMPLFTRHLAAAPQGVFISESPFDGVRRLLAYRVVPAYPQLVVAVGLGHAELLHAWRHFALLAAGVWAGTLLIAGILIWQLHRQSARRRQTELRFQHLAQAMPQIVFTASADGGVQYVNERWTEVTGLPVAQAYGRGWQTAMHPGDRERVLAQMQAALQQPGRGTFETELRLCGRDGGYRWHLLRSTSAEGGGATWYGAATDIDDMKQAQERLHAQAELLKMAGRLARLGGFSANLATRRVTWSAEAAAILDLPADAEPTMQDVVTLIEPRSLPHALAALQQCVEAGEGFDVEVEVLTPAGRRVWVRSIGQPLFGPDGSVVAIQGAQQDISQRVQLVEEIRQLNQGLEEKIAQRTHELERQEALFRTLAEQAPLPFWTVDTEGGATFFSRAWYELFGGAPPQWLGNDWLELLHPDDVAAVSASWEQARRTGGVHAGTRRLRSRDGRWHTTSYRAVPVRDEQGAVLFWVGVDSDITELSANAAALRLANEQLEAFAYSVSHDLQSPVQRIQSFARLLEEELQGGGGRAGHYLGRIRANAEAMTQLIDGLLALAQVSEVQMIRSAVNLSEMATGILQRLQADHPQRRVEWSVAPGLCALGDVRLLRSVLENLIGNAWKFTGERAVAHIEVGGADGEFFVRDDGAGFDMAYADRLFGTFQRLHAAEQFPGRGIGLATVARAISRMGGGIRAQAAPGQGAEFHFTLPLANANGAARA